MKMIESTSALLGERYVRFLHSCGLPVYVFPKKMSSTFAFFAVRYGSCDDVIARQCKEKTLPDGVAHFLEHKLFESEDGTDTFARFAALGADPNAYTAFDRTAYFFSCTDRFEESLAELIHFVTNPAFTAESVKREQGIIAEEIRMCDDSPWERGFQRLLEALYQRHPIRKSVCGTVASIKKITPELLFECYRHFYTPENMVLVVCGDVSPESVAQVVDEALPKDFCGRAAPKQENAEPYNVKHERVHERMKVSKPIFHIGVKDRAIPTDPAERLRRELAMNMLDEIVFSRSAHFYNDLFERGILSPNYSSGYSAGRDFGFYVIAGEADEPEAVLAAVQNHLRHLSRTGISDEDFERCRRVLYADEICSYDSTEEIASRLLSCALDGVELFSTPEVLQSITKQEIESLINDFFASDAFALSVVSSDKN